MYRPLNKTLLALLLALSDLKTPLSNEEKAGLVNVADQLYLDPDAWESDIEPNLLAIIHSNPNLNKLFQEMQTKLELIDIETLREYLPSEAELEQAIPSNQRAVTRGFEPGGDSFGKSLEINNMTIRVLSSPEPENTSRKLSDFDKIKEQINNQQKNSGQKNK